MDLLGQETQKKQKSIGQKIVLMLLITSILAAFFVMVMILALKGKNTKTLGLVIDNKEVSISENMLISDENGVNYISLKQLSTLIGYNYLRGAYKEYNEDITNTKSYLENENQIIQFEADNNKIYKTAPNTNLDYEEYELTYKILKLNNLLYIAFDDLDFGLNISYSYSEKDNKILLNTVDNLEKNYKLSLPKDTNNQYLQISDSIGNKKAISHNMLVVSNENQKWGVINKNDFSTLISNKYSSLEFVESAGVFIASDNNKYGVISKEPNTEPIIDLNYEEVNIINNKPLCYQVKLAGKYGIINEEGTAIINNDYESMGYNSQSPTEQSVLVIKKELEKNKVNELLVVCKEGKYGLVSLDNGRAIGECILDKIYAKNENGENKYYIELQGQEFLLDTYLEKINTTTVDIGT